MDLHFHFVAFVSMSNESYKTKSTQIPATTRTMHCAVRSVKLVCVVARQELEIPQISQDRNYIYLQKSFQKIDLLQW